MTPYSIEPLDRTHDRAAFASGVAPLDRYLREQASQDGRNRVAAVYVLRSADSAAVLGYYTLSAHTVALADLPPELVRRLPRYPTLPATLLGRLAVDQRQRGQRHGERLLYDALFKSLQQSKHIASMAVLVDAKDEAAQRFYERYGFRQFADLPYRLFIAMKTVEQLFAD